MAFPSTPSLQVRAAAELERRKRRRENPPPPIWVPHPANVPQQIAYLSEASEILYGGSAGGGKLLALDTPIPTPNGWALMGDLRSGDQVMGIDGQAITVVQAHDVTVPPECFRLTFDDGSEIEAGGEHRWLTFDAKELGALTRLDPEWRERRRARRASRITGNKSQAFTDAMVARNKALPPPVLPAPCGTIRTTFEIFDTLCTSTGRKNHAVPVQKGLQLGECVLPIDPYCLGAWLGDGSRDGGGFTGIDPEIWEVFVTCGYTVSHAKNKKTHYIKQIAHELRGIGVFKNKHIPSVYFRSSREQRLALLQGLMDTDGTVTDHGKPEFTNTNERIASGVYELIVSLGWKAKVIIGRATLYGKDCGAVYNIKWSPDDYVFRLSRKRNAQILATRRTTKFRYIENCQRIDPIPMRCITVSASDGLYLAGESMIPTHNSDLILGKARTQHLRSLLLRRTFSDLERSLISRSMEFFGDQSRYNGGKHVWHIDHRRIEFGHMNHIGTPQVPGDESSYASAPYDFISFDQLEQFPQYAYEFMLSRNRSAVAGQVVQMCSTANPVGENIEWIIRRWAPWLDPGHPNKAASGEIRWFVRRDDGLEVETTPDDPDGMSRTFIAAGLKDNPYLDDTYRKRLNLMPEPLRSALLNGDWTASIVDDAYQVIPRTWLKAAMRRWTPTKPGAYTAVGADMARGGADQMVLSPRAGDWFDKLIKIPGAQVPDGQAAVTMIINQNFGKIPINMDVIGIGTSAYDIGKTKFRAVPVNFAEGSDQTDASGTMHFINVRAQCYWTIRDALDPTSGRNVALPDDPELLSELAAPRWSLQTNGIKIEDKDHIHARIGHSPDCGDAVALAFYTGGSPGMHEWVEALRRKNQEREKD